MKAAVFLFILSLFQLPFENNLQAANVKIIHEDGTLELQSGEKINLAGIELAPESLRLLPPLLAGREVDIEYVHHPGIPTKTLAYLYVTTPIAHLPLASQTKPEEKKIMINEFLISIGAAKTSKLEGKHKDRFEKIEAEAQRSGQGIWSYNNPPEEATSEEEK